MKRFKLLSLLLAICMIGCTFTGCKKTKHGAKGDPLPYAINEMDVKVIDELPDWSGEQLDLSVWYSMGTNNLSIGKTKTDDKFQAEIKRVSGISFSEKTSFDNGGESADAKIAKIIAAKAWPHVVVGGISEDLAKNDIVWDLTDMIPKYMPNYMAIINSNETLRKAYDSQTQYDGKKYIWQGLSNEALYYTDPDFSEEKYRAIIPVKESRGSFWIRDDILKKLHPEALSLDEQKDIYVKNGEFTKDEIADFTVNSMDDFKKLLQDINDLNITENGKKVWPFYTSEGMDNWSLFAMFNSLTGAGLYGHNSYFVYYDSQEKKLKNPVKAEWFKEYTKFLNDLYREGLASPEAFIDTKAVFDQKVNNGEYAIVYGLTPPPSKEVLQAGGKDYSYRKVYIDVPVDQNVFLDVNVDQIWEQNGGIAFFKDMLTEHQVEQILRFIDFTYTDAGMKFAQWGPEKSGLYKENPDGTLEYTDKAFENAILYDGDDQVLFDYGYESFPVITTFIGGTTTRYNKYNAKLMYANRPRERVADEYGSAFNFGYVEPLPDFPHMEYTWDIWNFLTKVKGVDDMWAARQVIEDALKLVLVAKTDEEFEQSYAKLIAAEEQNGFNDKCFEQMNETYKELNGGDLSELENWKPNK